MDLKDKPFEHRSSNGTIFKTEKCSLTRPIEVSNRPENPLLFAKDVAEMIAYHTLAIYPELPSFQGYGGIKFIED